MKAFAWMTLALIGSSVASGASSSGVDTDPYFNRQWGLANNGGLWGSVGADIAALPAWSTYGEGVAFKIAIIDTGILSTHEDLDGRVIDGWDLRDGRRGLDAAIDTDGRGTQIAGIVAANWNGVGINGVNPRAELIAMKAYDNPPSSNLPLEANTEAAMVEGIRIAAESGARIVVIPVWTRFPSVPIFNAMFEHDEILFVVPAGLDMPTGGVTVGGPGGDLLLWNDNDALPFYPASYPLVNIVSVTGSTNRDRLWGNHGVHSVDLAAPGIEALTTTIEPSPNFQSAGCSTFGSLLPGHQMYRCLDSPVGAAALVAGAASFYWAQNPELTSAEVRGDLMASVDKLPTLVGRVMSGGRLDLFNLLERNHLSVCYQEPIASQIEIVAPTNNACL